MRIKYENAQALSKKHPETFYAPSQEELNAITSGKYVKVCAANERFWVKVTKVKGYRITGTIDNELIGSLPVNYGDSITFSRYNVYDITD